MSKLVFYKIRNTECDFCRKHKKVVTSVNETTYICADCAKEVNKHARVNEYVVKKELLGEQQ